MEIRHLSHTEIDKAQWDAALQSATNSLLYSYSWYLDALNPQWEAFVGGDYEIIMPIPVTKKWGIKFVTTPLFVQKLGVFSASELPETTITLFLEAVLKKYIYVDYSLIVKKSASLPDKFKEVKRSNYTLDISKSYEEIAANYSKDAKRNLKKNNSISFEIGSDYAHTIALFQASYGELSGLSETHFSLFRNVAEEGQIRKRMICATVLKADVIIGSALFFLDKNTAYYIMGAPTALGKRLNATHFIIDGFIQEFAGKLHSLDFEGSDIPPIAYFFQKWGSEKEEYSRIRGSKHKIIDLFFRINDYFRHKTSL